MAGHEFDVAVTFAGEDREFVSAVVSRLKALGVSVFFDDDAKVEMWGEDLTEFFSNVYEQRARFAVMFISAHYARKSWTQLERRSVLARALEERAAYLLPVRLDGTMLPGVRSTVAYLDGVVEGAEGIAAAISAKVGSHATSLQPRFNGRVPRSATEAADLLGERPDGWEAALFSYYLSEGIEKSADRYRDHAIKFARGGEFVASSSLVAYMQARLAGMVTIVELFESLLAGPAQQSALGAPGEEGDSKLIEHLASRMTCIYEDLLSWAYELRSVSTSTDEGREAVRRLADYANQPIEAIREFVLTFREQIDALLSVPVVVERQDIELSIEFAVPDNVSAAHSDAMQKLLEAL